MPGRTGEGAAEAAPTSGRLDLDRDLPPPAHSPSDEHEPARTGPDAYVVAIEMGTLDARMGGVGDFGQLDGRGTFGGGGQGEHVDVVHPASRAFLQVAEERRVERRRQIVGGQP